MAKLKIGVMGTGDVGKVLAKGLVGAGHEVMIGSRDAAKAKTASEGTGASGGTFADAARFGDVIILATLWAGTKGAIDLAGADSFAGKVVLDAVNPLDFSTGAPALAIGHTDSAGEQIQRWLPKARVVKAFNCVGNPLMVNPSFPNGTPDMFIAGNDADAKTTVSQICKELGWPTIDCGPIAASRYLEPLAMIWIGYAFANKSYAHAFSLLRK